VGIKEVDDGIWLVSFMDYDLGYIGLEERGKDSAILKQPFWPKDVNYVFGTFCKRISPGRTLCEVAEEEGL
jgi:hypothetical protein